MTVAEALASLDLDRAGREMHGFVADHLPICRSITGEGVRDTLRGVAKLIPIDVREVSSGTQAYDWTVPKEWNVRDAYVADSSGRRVIDFRDSPLHLVSYSIPVRQRMALSELRDHLHTSPAHPDWIPYRTSYYSPGWGFCISERQLSGLADDSYDVVIDSQLEDGSLTYGEYLVKGETEEEVLISCHVCHPAMANDNLSGIALAALLARHLSTASPRYSHRFLFIPGTIGSITWLSRSEEVVPRIRAGLVAACLGDPGPLTYKRSRRGDAEIDRAAAHVVARRGGRVHDFSPYGYDERQFNSPGFDLPVGCLSRTPQGEFPEYHSSADDLSLVREECLADSLSAYLAVLAVLEGNETYVNLSPKGEPQLGRRGLYPSIGGTQAEVETMALLWVLNQSDGTKTLLDIAERSGCEFAAIEAAATRLAGSGLLARAADGGRRT